jgi:hypothetical protein
MLTCNCTLTGTIACNYCSNLTKSFTELHDDWLNNFQVESDWHKSLTEITNEITNKLNNMKLVDESKFDITEKKNAKIARLKLELENYNNSKDTIKAVLDIYGADLKHKVKRIDEITKELKELEEYPK